MLNYTVLVIDDEENQRHALINKVDWESAGFNVIGDAENGIEALDLVEKLEPDLILTDIEMPMMSGLEFARQVREMRPATHIAILSGYDKFEYAQAAIQYNIIRYLLKPISSEELTKELKSIHAQMDKERDKLLGKEFHSAEGEDQTIRRLSVTEFLMPLMLGSTATHHDDEALFAHAAQVGALGDMSCPISSFRVIVSKFKGNSGSCTSEEHIELISTVFSKYLHTESFFAYGRIVTFAVFTELTPDNALDIALKEIVQSAMSILHQRCTIGVSRSFTALSECSAAYSQAVVARRYTSDGVGEVRFIEDEEHSTKAIQPEFVDESVAKLEQLLKTDTKEHLMEYLSKLYGEQNDTETDLLIIQTLAAVYRTVCAVSDNAALSELVSSNPIFSRLTSHSGEVAVRRELIDLCLNAQNIIANSRKREVDKLCDKVEKIIELEYGDETLSLSEVSHRLAVSPNYLSALIKKTKKKNFITMLTERRMKAAYDMLICSSMKILEIAERCGYSNQHYFSYCFKKFYGESPNKIRSNGQSESL